MAGEGMRWEKRWSPTDGRSCPRASEKSQHSLQVPNKLASPGSPLLGPSATWIREALSFNLILTRDHCQARDLTFSLWPSLPWILQAFRMSSRTAKATQANPGGRGRGREQSEAGIVKCFTPTPASPYAWSLTVATAD